MINNEKTHYFEIGVFPVKEFRWVSKSSIS